MRIGQHYYTWCHKEAGCEGIAGFQTRAKSASITAEIERVVKQYCSLYTLPRSVDSLTTKAAELTTDELRRCPRILHYYPISRDLWGLTASQLSANQKGRGGNFFAHTLVLPREALGPVDFNPFELVRSNILKFRADDIEGKQLSELSVLPGVPSMAEYRKKRIAQCHSVGRDRLQVVLSALLASDEESKKRPLILCTPDFQKTADLIEAILMLLPPAYRSGVAFSSYEPDPYRLLIGEDSAKAAVKMMIGTCPPEEGGKFQFREDEFKAGFYVFDFGTGRQSATPPLSEYVRVVCDAVERSDDLALHQLQEIITLLKMDKDPGMWDVILPAAFLLSEDDSLKHPEKWKSATEAITKGSKTRDALREALEILWRKSCTVLPRLDPAAAAKVISGCCYLLSAVGQEAGEFVRKEKDRLIQLFTELIMSHRYELSVKWLGLLGDRTDARRAILVQGLTNAMAKNWPKTWLPARGDEEEGKAFVAILDEGLRTMATDEEKASLFGDLLIAAISSAYSASSLCTAWPQILPWLLSDGLQRVPRDRMPETLRAMHTALSKANEYEGRRELGLWELKNVSPSEKEMRTEILQGIADACGRCVRPLKAFQDTLSEMASLLRDRGDMIQFFVLFHEEADADDQEAVLQRYRDHIRNEYEEAARWDIRRQISTSPGGRRMLSDECASMLSPWVPESARLCLRAWITRVIQSDDEFACLVSQRICQAIKKRTDPSIARTILMECLREFTQTESSYRKASGVLAETLIGLVPLEEFQKDRRIAGLLDKVDTNEWTQEARAVLQMATCYAQAERLPDSDYPNISFLGRDFPELGRTLSLLADEHWRQSATWIASGLHDLEVESPEAVKSLLTLLLSTPVRRRAVSPSSSETPGSPLDRGLAASDIIIGQLRSELLDGRFRRDLSTHVCCLSLFGIRAGHVLRQMNPDQDDPRVHSIARIVGAILAADPSSTRRLLRRRLETHGGRDDRQVKVWLYSFWRQVRREMRAARRRTRLWRRLARKVCSRRARVPDYGTLGREVDKEGVGVENKRTDQSALVDRTAARRPPSGEEFNRNSRKAGKTRR